MFFLQQNQRTREQNSFCTEVKKVGDGEMAQIMHAHVSKYKNDKIKFTKKEHGSKKVIHEVECLLIS
jgi:hypothetical protein